MSVKSLVLSIIFLTELATSSAFANMPMLTEKPIEPSLQACNGWAAKQDDEALEMWGIEENGKSSRVVALKRLAGLCMGEKAPDIVGFGSSVGFDRDYCKKHRQQKVCPSRNGYNSGN